MHKFIESPTALFFGVLATLAALFSSLVSLSEGPTAFWFAIAFAVWAIASCFAFLSLLNKETARKMAGWLRETNYTHLYRWTCQRIVDWLWQRVRRPSVTEKENWPAQAKDALSVRLYDKALLFAVAYPFFGAFGYWLLTGNAATIGSAEIVGAEPSTERYWTLGPIIILIFFVSVRRHLLGRQQKRGVTYSGSQILIVERLGLIGIALTVPLAIVGALAGALAGAVAGAFALAGVGALTGALAVALIVLGEIVFAFAGLYAIALVVTGVLSSVWALAGAVSFGFGIVILYSSIISFENERVSVPFSALLFTLVGALPGALAGAALVANALALVSAVIFVVSAAVGLGLGLGLSLRRAGALLFALLLALVGAVTGAVTGLDAVAGAVALLLAVTVAVTVALAFAVVIAGAIAGANAGGGAVAGALGVAGALVLSGGLTVEGAFTLAGALGVVIFSLMAEETLPDFIFYPLHALCMCSLICGLVWYVPWTRIPDDTKSLFVFLGVFPLINGAFDWISYGMTLSLLRRGQSAAWPFLWSLLDLLIACVLFLALGVALVMVLHGLDQLAGGALIDLPALLAGVYALKDGDWSQSWALFMVFSTMVPTGLHLLISSLALQGLWPKCLRTALARWVVRDSPTPRDMVMLPMTLGLVWAAPIVVGGGLLWQIYTQLLSPQGNKPLLGGFFQMYFDLLMWIAQWGGVV